MTGIFTTFNTAKRGMFAQQQSINTTSHNVANANTEGYSRQRVQLETTPGFSMPGVGMSGTGVQISTITRIRDAYLDTQIRYETSIEGEYLAKQDVLEQVEMIFMEPSDTGLNTLMGRMWDAWQEVSKSPENSNARTIVRDNAVTFTDTIRHMYEQLETLKNDSINLVEKKALDVHSIIDQVNSLNNQIFKVVIKDEKPNDLMDKRDLLLDELSKIMDFNATEDQYGRVTIESKGHTLLQSTKGNEMPREISVVRNVEIVGDDVLITLVRGGDSINGITPLKIDKSDYENGGMYSFLKEGAVVINDNLEKWDGSNIVQGNIQYLDMVQDQSHGELSGYHVAISEVASHQEQLDGLARAVAFAVNTIHTENGGQAFFVGDNDNSNIADINAENITVHSAVQEDVRLINTGKISGGPEGDGERALAIAQLRNVRLPIHDFIDNSNGDVDTLIADLYTNSYADMKFDNISGGSTFETYFKDMVAKLGISTQQANRMVENQEALTGQLIERRDSISGVSMNEEIANLIQFQHAYQANSKVISTLTLMLDTLINGMGV